MYNLVNWKPSSLSYAAHCSVHNTCVQVSFILINNSPSIKVMIQTMRICQRSHKVFSLGKKVKVPDLKNEEK